MKKEIFLILILLTLTLPTILAPGTDEGTSDSTVESIILTASENKISWETVGHSRDGFKVVWSKTENPTYPTRDTDQYHYLSDPEQKEDELKAFSGNGEYYVRVCEYLGGKCGEYSNQIKIQLEGDSKEEEKGSYEEEKGSYEEDKKDNHPQPIAYQEPVCNGCQSNETCYPLGHRINGTFCANSHNLTFQLTEESICENNFECESNVCVSGECISAGFIQKVMNWFKAFF